MLAVAAAPAWAHVTVAPAEAPAGAEQRYALTVPGEKPVPTTGVEVQLPAELRVISVPPPPGWGVTTQAGRDGRILGATWSGGAVAAGESIELVVVARNPDAAATLAWRVIQTYRDGSEVHWNGPPGGEFPAATSRVVTRGTGAGVLAALAVFIVVAVLAGVVLALRRRRVTPPP